ncbi:hypothetical protein BDA99DRAFT_514419 [Phascolomyces articulosus]|uniref:Uncharacterized protein n=1 Tax=Phascolomyces articulosus TaxID=60185 RepID=A0AAD5KAJ5_9FUNG|nr:hypothetical protein BDA99DRAFT_514419 [Phascolomyces articulosus]
MKNGFLLRRKKKTSWASPFLFLPLFFTFLLYIPFFSTLFKMHLNLKTSLLGLLSIAAFVNAIPIEDVSVTSVELAEEPMDAHGSEHLYVTVTRTDDLVDDDGSLLAERIMAVQVTFDVIEKQLHCNGVPVEIGVSNIQVEAHIASNPEKLTINSAEEAALLEDTFDIGLATVEVTATLVEELKTSDGLTFRRLNVQERITEINGENVVQTDAGQQVLDMYEDGSFERWAVDPITGFLLPGPAVIDDPATFETHEDALPQLEVEEKQPVLSSEHAGTKGCAGALIDPVVEWWNDQSSLVHGFITGGFLAFLFAIALGIRQLIVSSSANSDYDQLPISDHDQNQEAIWQDKKEQKEDEKRPFLS